MDIKRNVFLTLSYLYQGLMIYTGWLIFNGSVGETIGGFVISNLFSLCMSMIFILVSCIGKSNIPDLLDICPFTFGIFTHKRKRIYYSDLGYFYTRNKNDNRTVIVSKQGYITSQVLTEVGYNGSIEKLRTDIKSELDIIYKDELEKVKRKKELASWDGYIDVKSKRDDIINKII